MPRRTRPPADYPVHDHVALAVIDHAVSLHGGLNPVVHERKPSTNARVLEFGRELEVLARGLWPEPYNRHEFSVVIHGAEQSTHGIGLTVDDCHVFEPNEGRKYRKVRGDLRPVYEFPRGIGFVDGPRRQTWTGAVWLENSLVSDLIALVVACPRVYLLLHLVKYEPRRRGRIVAGLRVQTGHPEEQ